VGCFGGLSRRDWLECVDGVTAEKMFLFKTLFLCVFMDRDVCVKMVTNWAASGKVCAK
jgi:hypothetical protein